MTKKDNDTTDPLSEFQKQPNDDEPNVSDDTEESVEVEVPDEEEFELQVGQDVGGFDPTESNTDSEDEEDVGFEELFGDNAGDREERAEKDVIENADETWGNSIDGNPGTEVSDTETSPQQKEKERTKHPSDDGFESDFSDETSGENGSDKDNEVKDTEDLFSDTNIKGAADNGSHTMEKGDSSEGSDANVSTDTETIDPLFPDTDSTTLDESEKTTTEAESTNSSSDEAEKSDETPQSPGQIPQSPPSVDRTVEEPSSREYFKGGLKKGLFGAYFIVAFPLAVIGILLDWCMRVLEWVGALLGIVYGFFVVTALLIPEAHGAGRWELITQSSMHVLPIIIGIFAVGWIEDKVVNGGEHYDNGESSSKSFNRF